jgi:hypothetical protein
MPRAGGASSTPRLFGSIADVSGILDRPIESGDDEWGMMAPLSFQIGCLKS